MKMTYLYKGRYFQRTPMPDGSGNKIVYREKAEEDRLWQDSTSELFEEAQYYGKRVAKTISKSKRLSYL
jgi:hypothetical protein